MANRLWYLFFGAGLSRSLDDFGGQGEAPSHPELLDALACELVDSGWDVKHMIKLLVTSRAYRQSSLETPELRQRDPLNRLLARQASFRYPAEVVRDAALAISGLLVDAQGGASVQPYQPAGYYRHLNFPEREYQQDNDERQWRRGVYMHWQRQYLHPDAQGLRRAHARGMHGPASALEHGAGGAGAAARSDVHRGVARVCRQDSSRRGTRPTEARLTFAFRQAVSRSPDAEEQTSADGAARAKPGANTRPRRQRPSGCWPSA